MLLALDTEILLLDEPTAGMSLEEVPAILEVIRTIKKIMAIKPFYSSNTRWI